MIQVSLLAWSQVSNRINCPGRRVGKPVSDFPPLSKTLITRNWTCFRYIKFGFLVFFKSKKLNQLTELFTWELRWKCKWFWWYLNEYLDGYTWPMAPDLGLMFAVVFSVTDRFLSFRSLRQLAYFLDFYVTCSKTIQFFSYLFSSLSGFLSSRLVLPCIVLCVSRFPFK